MTILDVASSSFSRLPEDFGGTAIVGDGTDEDILKSAGIAEADAFVAVTQGDNRNIMAAQIARVVFRIPKVLCRIYDPLREDLYKSLGIRALSPTKIFSQMVKDIIVG